MDPLEALQKHVAKEVPFQEVQYNGETYYAFGDNAYPKNTLTGIPIYGKNDEYYTLEAIMVFYQNIALGHGLYVKEAASRDVRAITRIDRKNVQEYLEGKKVSATASRLPANPPISLRSIMVSEPESKRPRLDEEAEENKRIADKAQIEVRALNENLTVDRIAEMRRKRQMHQKKNIVPTDESAPGGSVTTQVKEIPKVRVHKTRENVMLGNRDLTSVLAVLESAKRQWEEADKKEKLAAIHANNPPAADRSSIQQQRSGYSRYAQETFAHDKSSEIQTEMSFIGSNLHALKKGAGLSKIEQHHQQQSILSKPMPTTPLTTPGGKRPSRTPIIVVPAALNTMINMYNARDILQHLTFVPSETRRNATNKKPTDLVLQRTKSGQTYNIRVIDNVDRLASEDWDRIIAIFAMGVAWQFKGWKWNGNPTVIFNNIPAFHLYYDNDKPTAQVQNWNVHKIPVAVTKRHMDKARFSQMWETIENFCRKNKPELCARLGLH
ncbi:unnamed protein product [Caenorhabditis bovis]|uniref:Cell division control protein 73 C-terminal domain-containing protein n=1 Tax=Caenorhabditis bovis TaxID=2654633 RepID=A0A8S1F645_9PELO|nr:unnamed protein product [Caenorhabditis bovis]